VFCKKDLSYGGAETHHICYARLGSERLRDVITLCSECHTFFHQNWTKNEFWKGKEKGHWEVFSLQHTAQICFEHWREDKFISGDENGPNLCSTDTCRAVLEEYLRERITDEHPIIDPHDIGLFVRNKRYEMYFEAEDRGLTVKQFLDEKFGPKIRGKNPLRRDAGKKNGPFDHTPESFKRHYRENKNLNILMEKVREIEEENRRKMNNE